MEISKEAMNTILKIVEEDAKRNKANTCNCNNCTHDHEEGNMYEGSLSSMYNKLGQACENNNDLFSKVLIDESHMNASLQEHIASISMDYNRKIMQLEHEKVMEITRAFIQHNTITANNRGRALIEMVKRVDR